MEKETIKELVDFRRKSDLSKKTFANTLKQRQKLDNDDSGGGDYWASCLSAISNVFRYDNTNLLEDKIEELIEKIEPSDIKKIKTQIQRNIDIISNFKDFDFQDLKPNSEVMFHKKTTFKSIINIKGIPIQARPNHVYLFLLITVKKLELFGLLQNYTAMTKEN